MVPERMNGSETSPGQGGFPAERYCGGGWVFRMLVSPWHCESGGKPSALQTLSRGWYAQSGGERWLV